MALKLQHRTISGENIELDAGPTYHTLGPDLVLEDCELWFEGSASSAILAGLTMIGGSLRCRRPSTNVRFTRARFEGVRFFGRYSGCDFGDRDDAKADVVNCDFSQAWLDGSRFKSREAETCRFGPWPTILLLDPRKNAPKLLEFLPASWHGIIGVLSKTPPGWGAAVLNIRQAIKEYGGSEENLRALFEKPFVRITEDV